VGIQVFRWYKGSTGRTGKYTFFFYRKGKDNHHRIESTVKRVEFVNDRMSYIVLEGRWFNIIFFEYACTR